MMKSVCITRIQTRIIQPFIKEFHLLSIFEKALKSCSGTCKLDWYQLVRCLQIWTYRVETRQRNDEIRTHNPNSNWNHSAIYESSFIFLAYLKGLKTFFKNM